MEITRLIGYMNNPTLLNDSTLVELQQIVEEYPYFQAARMLYLRNLGNTQELQKSLESSAIYISDRKKLYVLLNPESAPSLNRITKEDILTLSKEDDSAVVIDEPNDKSETGTHTLNNRYFTLEELKTKELNISASIPADDLISKFIEVDPRIKPPAEPLEIKDISESSVQENDEVVSETLAKIYVSQGLFKKAILMYEKLSLKIPEKSTYFATLIEEVKKRNI